MLLLRRCESRLGNVRRCDILRLCILLSCAVGTWYLVINSAASMNAFDRNVCWRCHGSHGNGCWRGHGFHGTMQVTSSHNKRAVLISPESRIVVCG